jgi:hypothetical protein
MNTDFTVSHTCIQDVCASERQFGKHSLSHHLLGQKCGCVHYAPSVVLVVNDPVSHNWWSTLLNTTACGWRQLGMRHLYSTVAHTFPSVYSSFVNCVFIVILGMDTSSHETARQRTTYFPWMNTNYLPTGVCVHMTKVSPLSQHWWSRSAWMG